MLNFNDKDKPEAIIQCGSCRQPLWKFKVRGTFSKQMSPVGNNRAPFDENRVDCPICGCDYFKVPKKKDQPPEFAMVDMNGSPFSLT